MKRALGIFLLASISINLCAPTFAEEQKTPEQKPAENLLPALQEKPQQRPSEIKAAVPNHPRQVLKHGAHFMVMDETGLMPGESTLGCGLYRDDTRYLSEWDLNLNGEPLTLLSANTEEGYAGRFVYGNKAPRQKPLDKALPEQTISVQRDVVIDKSIRERIVLTNYGVETANVNFTIKFASDFADMFEVRGQRRKQRGEFLEPVVEKDRDLVILRYKGLDNLPYKTLISFDKIKPAVLTSNRAEFKLTMPAKAEMVIESIVATKFSDQPDVVLFTDLPNSADGKQPLNFVAAKEKVDADYLSWRDTGATIETDNADFNKLCARNFRDLYILRQPTPKGECLSAGIPWFAVAFGRDQNVTAHETLPILPDMTREILEVLANYQGTKSDDFTEERSGRILHELRLGEMARCREIPFIPYYGTVDATPLWLSMLSQYVEWSGDLEFARKLWPNVERALAYLDSETVDGSVYLVYGKKKGALSNQGWKDSVDSVLYSTGELAKPPIALSEVQGYLYDAWARTASLAKLLGHDQLSSVLNTKAQALQKRFQSDFWMPQANYMAEALDGDGKQCDVISSNPGQTMSSGINTQTQNLALADKIYHEDMNSGWGIRTLSRSERAYNPLSYHDGSIWPHDNALIIEGLCQVGRRKEAGILSGGIFKAALSQPDYRLPELFCGYSRKYSDKPIWYPVSCSPQAWAAGSMFLMLESLLGLKADALNNTLYVSSPTLPPYLNMVTMKHIRVGKGSVDLKFTREGDDTKCDVLNTVGGVKVSLL